jgi:hypothetical protein
MWIQWIRIRNTAYYGERLTLTFSAMQASRGFLVSGQAQHGFSFLPSGPAPDKQKKDTLERERQFFRFELNQDTNMPKVSPKKMKKISCLKRSLLGWRLHLKPECTLYGFKKTYIYDGFQ